MIKNLARLEVGLGSGHLSKSLLRIVDQSAIVSLRDELYP